MKYRIAYTCENCQVQMAALLGDLAVAPLPGSLLTLAFEILGQNQGLPKLDSYDLRFCHSGNIGAAAKAFADHVRKSLQTT